MYSLQRDAQGRVTSAQGPGFSTSFGYDARGLRVRRQDASGPRLHHLEGDHLEAVYDGAGALRASYLRGSIIDEIVNGYLYDAQGTPSNLTFHHDRVTSVVAVTRHTGVVEASTRYSPFGGAIESTGVSPNTLLFTGREREPESGLYYYRARWYDPDLGRFLSEDPLGFGGGDVNLYAYVGNNPVRFSDPLGLESIYGGVQASAGFSLGGEIEVVLGADTSGNVVVSGSLSGGPHLGVDLEVGGVVGRDSRPTVYEALQGPVVEKGGGLDAYVIEVEFAGTSGQYSSGPFDATGTEFGASVNLLPQDFAALPAELHFYAGRSGMIVLGQSDLVRQVVRALVGLSLGDPYQGGGTEIERGSYPSELDWAPASRPYDK